MRAAFADAPQCAHIASREVVAIAQSITSPAFKGRRFRPYCVDAKSRFSMGAR